MSLEHSTQSALRLLKRLIPVPLRLLFMQVKSLLRHPPDLWCVNAEAHQEPLISCICVTRARPELLGRSIHCFRKQTWPYKELVIVYEDDDSVTRDFLANVRDSDIRILEMRSTPKKSLGELRNIAIRASRGSLFCQWDDDDWFHPERLATQYAYLRGNQADACILNHWIVFNANTGSAYISPEWSWEGSILCKRSVFSRRVRYGKIRRGEDAVFVGKLIKNYRIAFLNRPYLYIYVYHGRNTWDWDHWDTNIFSTDSFRLSDYFSSKIQEILAGRIGDEIAVKVLRSMHMISLVQCQE